MLSADGEQMHDAGKGCSLAIAKQGIRRVLRDSLGAVRYRTQGPARGIAQTHPGRYRRFLGHRGDQPWRRAQGADSINCASAAAKDRDHDDIPQHQTSHSSSRRKEKLQVESSSPLRAGTT